MIRETPIGASPLAHARYLHGAGRGNVTICHKVGLGPEPSSEWNQNSYPVEELHEVVPAYSGLKDVYISQNRFYGSRKIDRVADLSSLYTDLDYYKRSKLASMHAEGVLDLALEALIREQIPYPSLAMATGRGLALIWRHEPVPRHVLPKWARCQERIFEALKDLVGADSAAKSAAQVLRLAGTYNSKSGTLVKSIFENLDGIWDFGDLADEILPLTQEQLEERRAQLAAGGPRKASERREVTPKGFGSRTLHQARLDDLQRIMWLRGMDQLPPGQRDHWMFVAAVSLSNLLEPQQLERKLIALGKEYAGWSEAETRSRMQAVISCAHSAADGNKVEWNGQQRDPRYRLTNQNIIAMLGITPEEERHLKTLISKDTKRRRDRERKERERRSQGVKPRDEYIADARERRQHNRREARKLSGEGKSLRDIGTTLGISHTHVRRLLQSTGE